MMMRSNFCVILILAAAVVSLNEGTPEETVDRLKKEILKQNEDFGAKRAVFREMYMKQEGKKEWMEYGSGSEMELLPLFNQSYDTCGVLEEFARAKETINDLEVQVKRLQNELNETKSQVTVEKYTKENEMQMERQRRHKDLTSQRLKFEGKINWKCTNPAK
jgi:hypothetical protein